MQSDFPSRETGKETLGETAVVIQQYLKISKLSCRDHKPTVSDPLVCSAAALVLGLGTILFLCFDVYLIHLTRR